MLEDLSDRIEKGPSLNFLDLPNEQQRKTNSEKLVVVGMSGGVDSSVTAWLLKQQGYQVIGLFMKNWDEIDESGQCSSVSDYEDVAYTASLLDIPYKSVDFVKEYREEVFNHFLDEYKMGHTPNPDILCNREIKFKAFFKKAMALGADYLATGHYADTDGLNLLTSADTDKDQTYFLYAIDGKVLEKVLFPLGKLTKPEVREIARKANLPTQNKKDSTGICFIGERDFRQFLSKYIAARPGKFKTLDGSVVGEHSGVVYYTLGQRRGLGLGGPGERWFVVGKDVSQNTVYVERGSTHAALFSSSLLASEETWISSKTPAFPLHCKSRIRHRQKLQDCIVTRDSSGKLMVNFETPQRAIAIRQSVVFYHENICLGGAIIDSHGPTFHDLGLSVPSELLLDSN